MVVLFIILLPLMQVGFSYYLSVQVFTASMLVITQAKVIRRTGGIFLAGVLLVSSFILLSVFAMDSLDLTYDIFRRGREMLFFALTCMFLRGATSTRAYQDVSKVPTLVFATALVLFLLVLVQSYLLGRGIYFGLPRDIFILNGETLPDQLALRYNIARMLRPAATFGEPSYLGFILLSLLVMVSPFLSYTPAARRHATGANRPAALGSVRIALAAVGLILLAGLMSRSLAFFLAAPAVIYFAVASRASAKAKLWILGLGALFLVAVLSAGVGAPMVSRLVSGSGDASVNARIFAPIALVPDFLFSNPLGVPHTRLMRELSPYASSAGLNMNGILDNGLLNSFFLYGIFGAPVIALLVLAPRAAYAKVYVIAAALFNGAIFSFDKFFVVCFAVLVAESLRIALSKEKSVASSELGRDNIRDWNRV